MDIRLNIGESEKFARYIVGVCLLSLVVFLDGGAKVWGLLGLYPIATAYIEFDPIWKAFNINTRDDTPTSHHPAH